MNSSSGVSTAVLVFLILLGMMLFPVFTASADFHSASVSTVFEAYELGSNKITFNFVGVGDYQVSFKFPDGYQPASNEALPENFGVLVSNPGEVKTVEANNLKAVSITIIKGELSETHLFIRP